MNFLIVFCAVAFMMDAVIAKEHKIVCYFGSWAAYRPHAGEFQVEDIDASLCTHLIYTFVGLDGFRIKVLDPWQDLSDNWGKNGFGRFNALRDDNPSIKTLIAIGGWNQSSVKYSRMSEHATSRAAFARDAVKFLKKYDFDGLDVDWEYPAQRGGKPEDINNYVALLKKLRQEFDEENFLLTAAVSAPETSASKSYNIAEISKYLDFINIMAYDFHGTWEKKTGLHSALDPGSSDVGDARKMTVNASIRYWLEQGAPPEKLILGIPSYGRSFTLVNPDAASVGDLTTGPGVAGPYTREAGMLGYNEICEMQAEEEWTVKFDPVRRSSYAHCGDQWVGYDTIRSVKEKAEFVKKLGLGGAMMWSIETDDFRGVCGKEYPLLRTLNRVLRKDNNDINNVTSNPNHSPSGKNMI